MFLSQIELIGFKSFAKRTRINFHPGITGIVGPNGCGKSNIVDAVRWVMGEQKGSVLRSERMEQVIFNGTQTRKPLGMSEVSLTIENNLGILPLEYTEVSVSRRLYRNGESEYLLNKKRSRLKDTVDLFLDTGLGADSYGIIEPTLIQRILTDDPYERRLMFEEAAGIARYKLRVKTARKRLDGVNDNLERLTDILSEVERNVRSLKRQYNQAKTYEGLRASIDGIEISLLALDRRELLGDLQSSQKRLDDLFGKLSRQDSERKTIEGDLEKTVTLLNQNEEKIEKIRKEWERFQSESLKAENRILLIDEKERNAISEHEKAEESIERAQQRILYLDERMTGHKSSLDKMEIEFAALNEAVKDAEDSFKVAQEAREESRLELEKVKSQTDSLREELSRLEKESTFRKAKISSLDEQRERLEGESESLTFKLEEIAKLKAEAELRKFETGKELEGEDLEISRLEDELEVSKLKLAELEVEKSRLLISLERNKSELRFLQSLIESGSDRPKGVGFLLSRKPAGIIDNLANLLEVKSEYVPAVEAALGEAANYVLVETRRNGIDAIEILRNETGGRATVIPLNQNFTREKSEPGSTSGVVGTADELVECSPYIRELVSHLLGKVLVVKNWEDALKLHDSGAWRGLIVTLEGESMGDISISGGKSEAKIPAVGRTKRAEKLARSDEELSAKIRKVEREINLIKGEISNREIELEKVKKEIRSSSDKANRLLQKVAELEAQVSSLEKRDDGIGQELENLISVRNSTQSELESLNQQLNSVAERLADSEQKLESMNERQKELREDTGNKREEFHRQQLKLTTRQGELNRLKSEITLGESRLEELLEEISRLKDNIKSLNERSESLKAERTDALKQVNESGRLRDEWKEKLSEMESFQTEIKEERRTLDNKLKLVSSELENMKTEASALEIQSAEIRSRISAKEDTAQDKFGIELKSVEPPEKADRKSLIRELEKFKKKVDSIGPVNLLAVEEYGIQKERLEFLQSEYQDIIKSKEELMETISKTNTEARTRFKQVFEEVAEYFKLLFTDLFEGGEGELKLGSGDPLETEILLFANPAGKKLGTLDQMSGGEKTLAALALLFSLYQVKPSPFCVLDEVDAPLDDANIERFLKLIRRFTPKTQFILVTHNKLTMEACDYLFGVTMQEEGLSKIVSVEIKSGSSQVVAK